MASTMEKSINWSLAAVAFISVVMYAFLPLGIFGNNLDFQHFLLPKVIAAFIVAIVSGKLYMGYAKLRKISPEVVYFGLVTTLGITGLLTYVIIDLALKLFGLE
ncbi:hypothetical protein [Desulfurobacterium sp.]